MAANLDTEAKGY